ncbi:hypothetical protein BDP55DRAFT_646010 [Colletotrichum godetiae]|uniref:Uncharacterized protein n=1 Tax=Colletotrichum godetiae TaxID=1209918 RepID=A0AAJ0AXN4_9PEZI|nr:uncharacterized protein BDP55DRAFT_646010 [Colletotrichum godetiae]KAK1700143.1 hypothetical protein BDP55DRAFT_646010 [Colletotrichum godetiae]
MTIPRKEQLSILYNSYALLIFLAVSSPKPAIPKGSLVLVTGATGHIAAHTTKQFLERGLKVRGTVRILGRAKRLIQGVIAAFAERGDLELVHVPDLGAKHVFDETIKGVSAIAHIAWILSFSDDPWLHAFLEHWLTVTALPPRSTRSSTASPPVAAVSSSSASP